MDFSSEKAGSLPPSAAWLHVVCGLLIAASSLPADASVSGYQFKQELGAYTPITGGTQLIGGTGWNNEVFTVALPEQFWFDGQWYAEMHVACNGYITFGMAPSGSNFKPLSSAEGYAGAISPFGSNVWRANTTTSNVRWQQVGREVVVQWHEARRHVPANGESFSFQARLNLDNGVIRFVYSAPANTALSQDRFPQIGLRGPNNAFPTNVNNRLVDATCWYGNSQPGTSNASECRFTSKAPARHPAEGQTYVFAWGAGLELELTTDGHGEQTSWSVVPNGSTTPVCAGTGYASNTTHVLPCLLTAGQYRLIVTDAQGDGMCCVNGTGGYVLRDLMGERIIDNSADGAFTVTSSVTLPFQLPVGEDHLTESSCTREDVFTEDHVQATPDQDVRDQFGVGNQSDDGYQFWFFDPDGGYSRRLLMLHTTNNYMFPAGPDRCSFLKIGNISVSPLPLNKLLNVKVRSCVNGTFRPWGPACRIRVDLPDLCPSVQLLNDPSSPKHSCGITGVQLNGSRFLYATFIPSAHRYKFEFSRPGYVRNVTSNSSSLLLTVWGTGPLQYGQKVYNVRVTTSYDFGSTWCPFGPTCTITTAQGPPQQDQRSMEVTETPGPRSRLWPNPWTSGPMNVSAEGLPFGTNEATVEIIDLTGRSIMAWKAVVSEGRLNTAFDPPTYLANGIYHLAVTVADKRELLRFVVER